ncbi:MAG: hypothetical protein JRN15_04955 [Nitrososphaerota archaeon]|nr:hypothetical protein [Nitrososphaerota archaeon]
MKDPLFVLSGNEVSPAVGAALSFGEYGLYRGVLTASFVPTYDWLASIGIQDFASRSRRDALDDELIRLNLVYQGRSADLDTIILQIAQSDIFIRAFQKKTARKTVLLASGTQIRAFIHESFERIHQLISITQSREERSRLNTWFETYFSSMVVAIITQFHETASRYPASGYGIRHSDYDNGKIGITEVLSDRNCSPFR